nr:cyanoexosortase A [Fortiea contorta]
MININSTVNLIKQTVKNDQFWLLAIGASLIAINLTLIWRGNQVNLFSISCLFWMAISLLIWERRQQLNLESDILSSILGILVIAFVFFRSASPNNLGSFFHFLPVISALGLALLASGIHGIKQYQREIIALFLVFTSNLLRPHLIDISPLTAQFSTLILWYTGFEVNLVGGVEIHLPTGSVRVYEGCSGMSQIINLLALAILFNLIFPRNKQQKILISVVAVVLGFVVNSFRVVLLTILSAKNDLSAFDYWHIGGGSKVFFLIAALLFGCFFWFILRISETDNLPPTES